MKKIIMLALALLMALGIATTAQAADPYARMVIQDGEDYYYIGEGNRIYDERSESPLIEAEAASLVYADRARLLYGAMGTVDAGSPKAASLYAVTLGEADPQPSHIEDIVDCAYVSRDALVYYAPLSEPSTLWGYDPIGGAARQILDAGEPIVGLWACVDGLVVELNEDYRLYVPALNQLADLVVPSSGESVHPYGQFETLLDAKGQLRLRTLGQPSGAATLIDSDVMGATALSGIVYYIKTENGQPTLKSYDYATASRVAIGRFSSQLSGEMCATGDALYILGLDGRVLRLGVDSHHVQTLTTWSPVPELPVMWATPNRLLLFDAGKDDAEVHFEQEYSLLPQEELPDLEAEDAEPVQAEPVVTPKPTHKPEPEADATLTQAFVPLSKGSRGDDVLEVQQILHKHGYPVGKPDGIYGAGTVSAVKYLQYDMGRSQTGTVSEDFLHVLRTHKLPTYERYVQMQKGDKGIRVSDLQARLKKLGYLTGKADGDFGSSTVAAVKLFEKAMGDATGGHATVHVQQQLFSKNALTREQAFPQDSDGSSAPHTGSTSGGKPHKQSHQVTEDDLIELVRWMNDHFQGFNGDKKQCVYRLQSRLVEMGYMKKSQRTKIYDDRTQKALKQFQADYGVVDVPNGVPDKHTLENLF